MRHDLLQDADKMLKRSAEQLAAGDDKSAINSLREATVSIARFNDHARRGRLPKCVSDDLRHALATQKGSTITLTKATVAALLEAAS